VVIILKVIECIRERPSSAWERKVIDESEFEVVGPVSDTFKTVVSERTPKGEPLRIITFEAQPA